ncbi:hypothetical protein HI914_01881 [Erysiphe necator]|nr:hypothetical protein HI914_01881 [Erysiphe necator]
MEMMKSHASVDKALNKGLIDLNDFLVKMISHIPPEKGTINTIAIYSLLTYSYRELLLKAAFLANGDYTWSLVKKVSKAEQKKDTDVEMANTPPSDVQTTIDIAVKRAVQALCMPMLHDANQTLLITNRSPKAETQEGNETPEESLKPENRSLKKGRKRKRKWQREEECQIATLLAFVSSNKNFKPKDFSSYPDKFFTASSQVRSKFGILTSTVSYLDSLRAQQTSVFTRRCIPYSIPFIQDIILDSIRRLDSLSVVSESLDR